MSPISDCGHRDVYYGLHHESCCRYFREELSSRPLSRGQLHTELRDRFNRPEDPESGEVAQLLGSLMILRSESDYQLGLPLRYRGRSYTALELMQQASGDLLDALEAYSPGEAPDGCECRQAYSI